MSTNNIIREEKEYNETPPYLGSEMASLHPISYPAILLSKSN